MKHEHEDADTPPSRSDVEAIPATEQDAVFGDLSAGGPDYRSVSPGTQTLCDPQDLI